MEGIAAIVASSGLMSDQCAKSLLVDLDIASE
jgi:hypothetical protein